MLGFEDIGSKGHFFSQKGGRLGVKTPPRGAQFFKVKITSKMNSEPSNYSECKFFAKSDNF